MFFYRSNQCERLMLDFLKYYGRCDTYYKECMVLISHPGLTRVSSIIRFLQFEIKREDLFMLYFFLQNAYADKKEFKKKVKKIVLNGSNCYRKSQLYGILTELLNLHFDCTKHMVQFICYSNMI